MGIGLLSVVESSERAPLVRPVWCGRLTGDLVLFSTHDDRSLEAVRRAGRATVTVSRASGDCVSVEGTLLVTEPADPDEVRRWAVAYLGTEPDEEDIERMTTVRLRAYLWHPHEVTCF